MAISGNELYNYFISIGLSPREAAQNVAYQRIVNPKGNIASIKLAPKWYTQEEWYDFSAPDYVSAISYQPVSETEFDPLALYTRNELNKVLNEKGTITFGDLSNIASRASVALRTPEYNNTPFSTLGISTQDYYNQLKDIVSQKQTAERSFETQTQTHPFSQYGLPDPTIRFGLVNDPNRKVVAYKPAVDYVSQKVKTKEQQFRAAGLTGDKLKSSLETYSKGLAGAVQKKIDESGISPFVVQATTMTNLPKGK